MDDKAYRPDSQYGLGCHVCGIAGCIGTDRHPGAAGSGDVANPGRHVGRLGFGSTMGGYQCRNFHSTRGFWSPGIIRGQGGLAVLVGPTGGYIWSWPLAAFLIGWMTERSAPRLRFWKLLVYHVVWGMALIYLCGTLWMMFSLELDVRAALAGGVLPFIPGDAVKAVVASTAALSLNRAWPILRPRREPVDEKTA